MAAGRPATSTKLTTQFVWLAWLARASLKMRLASFAVSSADDTNDDNDEYLSAMAKYPADMKEKFGEIMWYKPNKKKNEWFPVLIYDPARLKSGGVREIWQKKIENGKPEHLLFYYGNLYKNSNAAYDTVKNSPELITYEEGVAKGLPAAVEKMAKKAKKSRNETLIIAGMEQVKEELLLSKDLKAVWMRAINYSNSSGNSKKKSALSREEEDVDDDMEDDMEDDAEEYVDKDDGVYEESGAPSKKQQKRKNLMYLTFLPHHSSLVMIRANNQTLLNLIMKLMAAL